MPADERGDEARAADRLRQPVAEKRSRERHDLKPGGVDEAPHRPRGRRRRLQRARDHASDDPVPDLLQDELRRRRRHRSHRPRQRDGKRNEEERDANPVVQPALDVEALADAVGKARRRDDGLAERSVGRREDDREEQRLGPREITEQRDPDDEPRREL